MVSFCIYKFLESRYRSNSSMNGQCQVRSRVPSDENQTAQPNKKAGNQTILTCKHKSVISCYCTHESEPPNINVLNNSKQKVKVQVSRGRTKKQFQFRIAKVTQDQADGKSVGKGKHGLRTWSNDAT